MVVLDTHYRLIIPCINVYSYVEHKICLCGNNGYFRIFKELCKLGALFVTYRGYYLKLARSITRNDAYRRSSGKTAPAVGIGDNDAFNVFDYVTADLYYNALGHFAQSFTRLCGAVCDCNRLRTAHSGGKLFFKYLQIRGIKLTVTVHR